MLSLERLPRIAEGEMPSRILGLEMGNDGGITDSHTQEVNVSRNIGVRPLLIIILILTSGRLLTPIAHSSLGLANGPGAWPLQIQQPSMASPTQSASLDLVAQVGGTVRGIAVQGDYAYAGVGPRLIVLDVSDPWRPSLVGQTDPLCSVIGRMAIYGDYVYALTNDCGLHVISTADPAHPIEAGVYTNISFPHDITIADGYAYIVDSRGLYILSLANPAQPSLVGSYNAGKPLYGVDVAGSLAFATYESPINGLFIFSVSNPSNPVMRGSCDTTSLSVAWDVAVNGQYAYIAHGWYGLAIVSIADPGHPSFVKQVTASYAVDIEISGTTLYLARHHSGISTYSISSPNDPTWLDSLNTPGFANSIAAAATNLYLADSAAGGVRIVSVSDPGNLIEMGTYGVPAGEVVAVAPADGHVYLSEMDAGVVGTDYYESQFGVIAVVDPGHPESLARQPAPGQAGGLDSQDALAALATGENGLYLYDVADPGLPFVIGHLDTPGSARGVALDGSHAYVADGSAGLRVIDVGNPYVPTEVGVLVTPGSAWAIALVGDLAYLAAGDAGLRVISIANPANPIEIGMYDTPGNAYDVHVEGQYAYVADGSSGLQIVDVSDPAHPTEVGLLDTPGYAHAVDKIGAFVLIADWYSLIAVDVTSVASPQEIATYDTPGAANDVQIQDRLAYVADSEGGLLILDLDLPFPPITASFYALPIRGLAPLTVQFYNTSDGEIDSVTWSFGDGQTSSEAAPQHVYTQPGSFSVSLEVVGPWTSDTETRSGYVQALAGTIETGGQPLVAVQSPITVTFYTSVQTDTIAYLCDPDPGGWEVSWLDSMRSATRSTAVFSHAPYAEATYYQFYIVDGVTTGGETLVPFSQGFITEGGSVHYLPSVFKH